MEDYNDFPLGRIVNFRQLLCGMCVTESRYCKPGMCSGGLQPPGMSGCWYNKSGVVYEYYVSHHSLVILIGQPRSHIIIDAEAKKDILGMKLVVEIIGRGATHKVLKLFDIVDFRQLLCRIQVSESRYSKLVYL
ncbi:MAG: hypothetical protein AAGF95_10985 [Chloroflexota bacterium]